MKSSWIGIGFSHHRVPSLSNTATRSSTGTAAIRPRRTYAATKSTIACLVGPSRQLDSNPSVIVHSPVACVRWLSDGTKPVVDAAEPEVAHAGVDHLRSTGGRAVAEAVAVGAQVRAALDHPARDPERRSRPGRSCGRRRHLGGWWPVRSTSRRPVLRGVDRSTSRRSTPTRCPPCRGARTRSQGSCPRERSVSRAAPRRCCATGSRARPRLLAMIRPPGLARSPHVNSAVRRDRPGRRTPTPPPSAAPGPHPGGVGLRVLLRHVHHRVVTTIGDRARVGPSGRIQHAPGVHLHHWLMWRRSTGPGVGVNTSEPATRFSGGAPGYAVGSSGRSATVT